MAESTEKHSTPKIDEDESDYNWENYKKKFGKSYSPEEDARREEIFNKKVKDIRKINALYAEGKSTYQAGVNKFTDQTDEETGKMFGVRKS